MSPINQFRIYLGVAFLCGWVVGVVCVLGTLAVGS
jgi:hypothetical protein